MWELLPPIVLFIVYDHLDLHSKLSASAACRNWRDALFNPKSNIHEKLHAKFHCRPRKRTLDFYKDMCKLFLRHTKCLILDWCECQEDLVLELLSITGGSLTIQQAHFLSKGDLFCQKKSGKSSASANVTETIVLFIENCKNLRSIDFGSNSEFCHDAGILNVLDARSSQKQLNGVNLSCYFTDNTNTSEELHSRKLSLIKDNLFCTVTEITINWDEHFEDLITTLVTIPSPVEILGLLVQNYGIFKKDLVTRTTVAKLWKEIRLRKPDLKVKMYLTEIRKGQIKTVFDNEMPLVSLHVVCSSEEFAEIVLDNLSQRTMNHICNCKLNEIGFHFTEFPQSNTFFVHNRYSNISNVISHLCTLDGIQKISWSGQFIVDKDLLFLVTKLADSLQELLVHKQDIVCVSLATQEYYIPLASAKVHGLEKAISVSLGKPWEMLCELPIQRTRRPPSYPYIPGKAISWVLQNKGFERL